MSNSGNFVNRITLARRRMWIAVFMVVVATSVAVVGWTRKISDADILKALGSKVHEQTNCEEYAEIMCNN